MRLGNWIGIGRRRGGGTVITLPNEITGLSLWMNADDITGNDGDLLSAWVSSDVGAYSFDAATTKRPTLKKGVNGINGHNVVRFNGTANIMRHGAAILNDSAGTLFVVYRAGSTILDGQSILASSDEGGANYFIDFRMCTTLTLGSYKKNVTAINSLSNGGLIVPNETVRAMWRSNGTAIDTKVNNHVSAVRVTTGSNNGDWFGDVPNRDNTTIGGLKYTAEINFVKGDIAQIIYYNTNLSDANVAKVEAYIESLYGNLDSAGVAFGDSVTFGVGATSVNYRWSKILQDSLAYKIQNTGISGTPLQNTIQNATAAIGGAVTYNGRDTYLRRINYWYPTYVFILYGLNDLRLNDVAFTDALYANDLGEIVDGLIATGITAQNIVIGSPPYMVPAHYGDGAPYNGGSTVKHQAYVAAAAGVATAKGTKYIDVYQWMIDNGGDTLMSADFIHPNDAGHAAIAAAFLSVL